MAGSNSSSEPRPRRSGHSGEPIKGMWPACRPCSTQPPRCAPAVVELYEDVRTKVPRHHVDVGRRHLLLHTRNMSKCSPSGPAGGGAAGVQRRSGRRSPVAPPRPPHAGPPTLRPPHLRRLHLGARHRAQRLWACRCRCARCQPETVARAAASAAFGDDPKHGATAGARSEGAAEPSRPSSPCRPSNRAHSPACCQP